MKIAVIPNGDIKKYKNADALILGLKDLSVNVYEMDLSEIEALTHDFEVFVAINKNIHNNELEKLENALISLSKLNIKGILYADISVLTINNDLKLNLNLIWSQEHLTTNYHTINYWCNSGASGVFISNDITKREILEITDNTNCTLMTQVFGYIPIYTSRRHAVKNYLNNFNLDINSKSYYLEKEEKEYPIVDFKNGTSVYSNNILCALKEILEYENHGIDYAVINFFNIDSNEEKIIDIFKTVTSKNYEEYDSFIKSNFSNIDTGFLYLETIYKVK